ncbi:MAG: hypothetical protein QXR17_08970 [Candidatus Bathyarchaeia archaeon]
MVRDWFIHLTRTKKYEEFITSAVLLGELLRTRKLLYATTIGGEIDYLGKRVDALFMYVDQRGYPGQTLVEYASRPKDVSKWPDPFEVIQVVKDPPNFVNEPIIKVELELIGVEKNVKILKQTLTLPSGEI